MDGPDRSGGAWLQRGWACEGRGGFVVHIAVERLGFSVKNVTALKVCGGMEYDLRHPTYAGLLRTIACHLWDGDGEEENSTS